MYISEVLMRVDELYPNSYTKEQKMIWCYEVSCTIRKNIRKIFDVLTYDFTGNIVLPDDIDFDDIVAVFVNGKKIDKVDERSFCGEGLRQGDSVRVVYQVMPELYAFREVVDIGEGSGDILFEIENGKNKILISSRHMALLGDIVVGDSIFAYEMVAQGANDIIHETKVLEIHPHGTYGMYELVVQDAVINNYGILQKIRHEFTPDYLTECEAPFDVLYLDYVMAQIAYYQNDLLDYNKFVSSYNQKIQDYMLHYKEVNPMIQNSHFKNLW